MYKHKRLVRIHSAHYKSILSWIFSFVVSAFFLSAQAPNVLWITIEDTSPQFIGCYDNPNSSTPVIDQLAKEGVRFTNAFSTGTVCSPSRSTIITGARTLTMGSGHHRSGFPIPSFIRGFPAYLQEQGYYTSNNSKTDYNIADVQAFTKDAWNESSNQAGWWNRKPGQAFFSVFNFAESHQSRTMTHPYDWYLKHVLEQLPEADRITEDAFEMPPFYRDSPTMRKHFARVYNSIKLTDNRIGQLLYRLEEDKLRDSTIIFIYADHGEGIPRGKTNGLNLGYRVPFIIWFPEMYQHLSPWGTAGVVSSELISFEDLAPSLIHLTGGTLPDYLKGRTLLGPQRSKPVDHLFLSSDRADNGPDMVRSITDGRYLYSRNFLPFNPQMRYIRYVEIADITVAMRKDYQAKLLNPLQESIFTERPIEYLFDIEKDTWETKNLAQDPAYKKVLRKMRKQLDRQILQYRDVHFLPEYELAQISSSTTPYEYRLSQQNYPLKKIYKAAQLSGYQSPKITKRQVQLLKNDDPIIRYWAIVGLQSQSKSALVDYQREINAAMLDHYHPIAIIAAAISFKQFENSDAQEVLKAFSQSEDMHLALLAINHLLYLEDKAPFIETIQAVYEIPGRNYPVKAACLDFLGILKLIPNDFEHGN